MAIQKPEILLESDDALEIADLDSVLYCTVPLANEVFSLSIPFGDSAKNRVSNYKGKVRTILLGGIHSGAGYSGADPAAKINAFIADVNDWANVGAQTRRRLKDVFGNQYLVFCTNFTWNWIDREMNQISYSFVFVEGGDFVLDLSDFS